MRRRMQRLKRVESVAYGGATGFLGSNLCRCLAHKRYSLRALARPTSDTLFLQALGVQVAAGDVRDLASVRAAMADCDTVIHAVARFRLWGPPELFEEINLWGTRNVRATAYALDVKRFLHISTIIVVGPQPPGTIITEDTPCGPYHGDNYACTKMGGERLALSYAEVGLPAVMINFARLLEFVAFSLGTSLSIPLTWLHTCSKIGSSTATRPGANWALSRFRLRRAHVAPWTGINPLDMVDQRAIIVLDMQDVCENGG